MKTCLSIPQWPGRFAGVVALGVVAMLTGCAAGPGTIKQQLINSPRVGQPVVHIVALSKGDPVPNPLISDYNGICLNLQDPACSATLPQNRQFSVDVRVTDSSGPVILGLDGFYRIHWRLQVAPGVRIKRVVAVGYYPQTVTGVPKGVPVETRSFGQSFCWSCFGGHTRFYDLRKPAPIFADLIEAPVTTFQSAFQSGNVTVVSPR